MRRAIEVIIRWEWLILLALSPLFLFPNGPRGLIIIVIPILWLLRKWVAGYFLPPTPYNIAILLLMAALGLSVVVAFDPALHFAKLVGLLLGIGLFFAVVEFGRRSRVWPVVGVVCGLGAFVALVGLLGMEWTPPLDLLNRARAVLPTGFQVPGAVGGVINANELAGVLCWVAPLALALLLGSGRRLWRRNRVLLILLAVTAALTGLALVATQSRGGILAYSAGVTLAVALFLSPRWRLVLITGFVIAVGIVISYAVGRGGGDIVGDTLGLSGRVEIWSRALLAIGDFPLTGVGLNGFRRVVHVLYPLFTISADIDLGHAHNHLLQAALDAGLPGLVAYLALWLISCGLLWSARRNLTRRKAQGHPYYPLVAGLAGSLLAGWVFGLFDAVALGARPSFVWWLLLGLTAATHYAVAYSGERLRLRRPMATSEVARAPVAPYN
jgi:hypothetical protein